MMRRSAALLVAVALASGCAAVTGHERAPVSAAHGHASARSGFRVVSSVALDFAPAAAAPDGSGIIVTVEHRGVAAIDAAGRVRWVAALDGASAGAPVVVDDRIVVPTARTDGSGGCAALDHATGERAWTHESIGTGGAAVARTGSRVICVMRDGRTMAIPVALGFTDWAYTFAVDVDPAAVEVQEGTEIAVDRAAGWFAFLVRYEGRWAVTVQDLATGRRRALTPVTGPRTKPRVVARVGDLVVELTTAGRITAHRRATHAAVAVPVVTGRVVAAFPGRSRGTVVVVSRGGSGGRIERWQVPLPQPGS